MRSTWSSNSKLMGSNDFRSVGAVLAEDYILEWPRSKERIRGKGNFAAMNEEYPAHGRWRFTLNRIVGNEKEVVTDVSVTDGVQNARVISFFTDDITTSASRRPE